MQKIYRTLLGVFVLWTGSLNLSAQTYQVGSGTGSNTSSTYPCPYNNYWSGGRHQFLIRATELTAAGASAGVIKSLAFNVLTPNDNSPAADNILTGLTIRIGTTALTSLTGYVSSASLTTVYSNTYSPSIGWNTHNFNSCYTWNGTSNLIVEVCFTSTGIASTGATTQWTTGLGFNGSVYTSSGGSCTTTSATTSSTRPNMRFYIIPNQPDIAVQNVTSPAGSVGMGSFPVTMNIINNSCTATITTATVGYNWNNGGPVTQTWSGSLSPGATTGFTFTTNPTATSNGPNSLKVWTTYPNGIYPDAVPSNDTLSTFVYVGSGVDTSGYNGKDFWVAFMKNYDNGSGGEANWSLLLTVATINAATVTITAPNLSGTPIATLTMAANSIQTVTVPATIGGAAMATTTDEVVANTGIHIVANTPITVYGLSLLTASTDGFLAIPTNNLGTQYLAFAPTGVYSLTNQGPSEFIAVATQNNTVVNITPKTAARTKAAGAVVTATLNAGQTYMICGKTTSSSSNDETGSLITSSKPIAVFGGSNCSDVPWLGASGNCAACNHLVEELTPTSAWGKHFLLGHFATRTAPDFIRVISSYSGTTNFSVNGTAYTLVGAGSYKDITSGLLAGAEIISNQGIYVIQLSEGTVCDGVANSDPMTISVLPEEQWGYYYPSATPGGPGASYFSNNNFLSVIKKGSSSIVLVDGAQVPQANFSQIGTSGYYATQVGVSVGNHVAVGNTPFLCYSYGFDNSDAYGYPASGANLYSILLPIKLATFTGKNVDGIGVLNWTTAIEINNDHFSIERSNDGINFVEIASRKGAGSSQITHEYVYMDKHMQEGMNYYRLKQVDFNGQHEYSPIISIDAHINDAFKLNYLKPNPASSFVNVSFHSENSAPITFEVTDVRGKLEKKGVLENNVAGENEHSIDISELSSGIYFIQLANEQGQSIREKLVKQ